MCKKYDKNSNVWKEKGRIPMFKKKGQNSNVYIDSARIPMFEGEALNSHVWKDKIRIEMLIKNTGGILLFGHRRSEFQCLQE